MTNKKILLIEPSYKADFKPLGLMRISTWHKNKGDSVEFIKGEKKINYTPDKIYITTLFTYKKRETLRCVRYYRKNFPKTDIIVGGIMASLHPEIFKKEGVRVHVGLLKCVENCPPDYDLFPEMSYSLTFACYDDKTEVLTKEGFKFFKDIKFEDEIATLNQDTHELKYQKPKEIINERYIGELFRVKNKFVDLLITPNHKLFVNRKGSKYEKWELSQVTDVCSKCNIKFKKSAIWKGKEQKHVSINGDTYLMDDWLKFLGYYISEGNSFHNKKNHTWRVKISQNKDSKHYEDIRNCIEKLRLNYYELNEKKRPNFGGFEISKKSLYQYLKPLGYSYEKFIPTEYKQLSIRQLKILLTSLINGDGYVYEYKKKEWKTKGGFAYITTSKRLIDDVQEILLKIGIAGDPKITSKKGTMRYFKRDNRFITSNHDCYQINSNNRKKNPILYNLSYKRQITVEKYNGRVYCVEVPNGVIYVRRNSKGVWCGNSRGCVNSCPYCIVPILEKGLYSRPNWIKDVNLEFPKLYFFDNNWLAKPKEELFKDIELLHKLKKKGIKEIDFNQSLDAREVTDEVFKRMKGLNVNPMRFSFDHMGQDKHCQKAIELSKKYGFTKIHVDVLYNWNDTIEDFYYRLKELCKLGCSAILMRYAPIDETNRDYVGRHWTRTERDGVNRLNPYPYGQISSKCQEEFELFFGKDAKEFKRLLNFKDIKKLTNLKFQKFNKDKIWKK